MNKITIINQVKEIILKFAKPNRIYLYGSQVSGEAKSGSDIDIAYDDPNFKSNFLIEEE
ncbi:MAG: nucleotidyltransferase domain-containing protein, partial [Epsilonproteobacteria bacterium]|nr:nucleotidyltransferase domain-containing protein [Campylobacterota bacterium]